ncbi:MAG TPA: FG-GAP and VCBS repeat-containing protein [Cellulomonas sp.]
MPVSSRRRPFVAVLGLALATPFLLLTPPASAAVKVAEPYDFDGDGFPELVVGAPQLQVGSVRDAGGITVLPGSTKGLPTKGRTITQATTAVAGDPKSDHAFGTAFASADFDHDGFADLAVGAEGGTEGGSVDPGSVTVLFGSPSGLTGARSYVLTRPGAAEDDGFGASLVAADLDGDGWADLAVGAPYQEGVEVPHEDFLAGGTVTVLHGSDAAFSTGRSTVLVGLTRGERYDEAFGAALAVGDVDGDRHPDLVVASAGLSFEDGDGHAGYVTVCPSGTSCTQIPSGHGYPGITALAVGNVTGSSRPEIVVGLPDADEDAEQGGAVWTLTLSGSGAQITAADRELTQDTEGVPGSDEDGDAFGAALALGDLDSDGYADLVVGSPGEAVGRREGAGRVTVVHGGTKGYRTSGNKTYDQNTKRVPGTAEARDGFGGAVTLLDHDADGHLDLTVGAPGENDGAGAVTTLEGSGSSFTTKGSKTFGLHTLDYPTPDGALFGLALGG